VATTPVPAVDRAVTILRLLTERWDAPWTLSEISRETEIHKATCAALLGRLVAHGFVRRTADKSYMLGPEMLSMAFGYARRHPGFTLARQEIFALAERTGLGCSICVPDGDELVILDVAGDVQPTYLPTRIGRRLPFAPPLGNIFRAWSTPEEIERWLSQTASDYDLDLDQLVRVVSNIRSRGYSLGSEQDFDIKLDAVMRRLERQDTDLAGISVALMLADKIRAYQGGQGGALEGHEASADYIVGPVFDHRGHVVMSIQLFGAPGQIPNSKVEALASELLAATRRITSSVGGTLPASSAPV
jgi:DNA-binding IclR family transcriptional regulator